MTSTTPTLETSNINKLQHHGQSAKLQWQHGIATQLSQLFNSAITSAQICPHVGSPKHTKHGQFALPLHRIKPLFTTEPWCSQTASETAQWIVTKIAPSDYIESASAIGTFVNFVIPKTKYVECVLQEIIDYGHQYGFGTSFMDMDNNNNATTTSDSPPLMMVSCDLPMVPLPLNPNHFRGLVLATFLQRASRIQGQNVQLVNTLNAWNDEFGYLALAVSKYGPTSSSEIDGISYLNQIYLQIKQDALIDKNVDKEAQKYLMKLEQGEDETIKLWQELQTTMTNHYQLLFDQKLCIEFDRYIHTQPGEDIKAVYQLLENYDGLVKTTHGEWKIDLESVGLGTPLVRDSNGISTQLTRDIAQIIKQERMMGDEDFVEYHIAGHHLTRHIQQVHHIVTSIKRHSGQSSKQQRIHVDFGKVKYDTTSATRFSLLESLDSLQQTMLEIMEENEGTEKYDAMMAQLGQLSVTTRTKRMNDDLDNNNNGNNVSTSTLSAHQLAEQHAYRLGLCTMIIHQFTQRRIKPMSFSSSSPPEVFGNSGVFLQYVHSRLSGIEQQLVKRGLLDISTTTTSSRWNNNNNNNNNNRPTTNTHDMGKLLYQQEAFDLAEWMTQFPRIMEQACINMDPSSLVSYLFKLARMANQALYGLRIKDVQEELALARWTLFWAARQTLANGLVALGIEPVYRM